MNARADSRNRQAWSLKESIEYYGRERTRVADLYESESRVLLPIVPYIRSVLDVGCAVGSFVSIFKELTPDISYVGVDIAEGMIEEARRRHPDIKFHLGSGNRLPFEDNSFDLVFCAGVLNHNPEYPALLEEVLRVTRRFAVVDSPRLVNSPYAYSFSNSFMELRTRFGEGEKDSSRYLSRVPYVLANAEEMFRVIQESLWGRLSGFACCGYYGQPHPAVRIPFSSVIFSVMLLVKGHGPVRYWLRLPEDVLPIVRRVLSGRGTEVEVIEKVIE